MEDNMHRTTNYLSETNDFSTKATDYVFSRDMWKKWLILQIPLVLLSLLFIDKPALFERFLGAALLSLLSFFAYMIGGGLGSNFLSAYVGYREVRRLSEDGKDKLQFPDLLLISTGQALILLPTISLFMTHRILGSAFIGLVTVIAFLILGFVVVIYDLRLEARFEEPAN